MNSNAFVFHFCPACNRCTNYFWTSLKQPFSIPTLGSFAVQQYWHEICALKSPIAWVSESFMIRKGVQLLSRHIWYLGCSVPICKNNSCWYTGSFLHGGAVKARHWMMVWWQKWMHYYNPLNSKCPSNPNSLQKQRKEQNSDSNPCTRQLYNLHIYLYTVYKILWVPVNSILHHQ